MKRIRRRIFTPVLLLACFSMAGCYQRVIRAEGYNAQNYDVYEPAESNTILDRAYDDLVGTEKQ